MKIGLTEILLVGGGLWLWSRSKKTADDPIQWQDDPQGNSPYWASWPGAAVAVNAAIVDASLRFPLPETKGVVAASVHSVVQVEWPNSSLGVPEPGRTYAQVITPGYKITLNDWGHFPVYHADRNGRVVYAGG